MGVLGHLVYFIFMGTNDREMAERIYQTVRIRVCPNNGFYSDDICYFTHHDLMNWNEAQKFCRDKGGHLAEWTSSTEEKQVEGHLDKTKSYWIGLTDNEQE